MPRIMHCQQRPEGPSMSTDEQQVKNRRLTIKDFADIYGGSVGLVKTILIEHLGCRRIKSGAKNCSLRKRVLR